MVKADILKIADEEEAKFKSIAMAKEAEENARRVLTYEEYYQANPNVETKPAKQTGSIMGNSRKDTTYEQYLQSKATRYIFDHDILPQAYKFWESNEDREERLKRIWIDLKRKNALGGIEARNVEEQDEISTKIVELCRKIRYKLDQELTRHNIEPLFKENYRAYDKEEFLLDADMEFFKIKKLLEKNPKQLKEDPVMGIDYLKIINLIRRKKLVEDTSDHFKPADQVDNTFFDIDMLDQEEAMRKRRADEKFQRDQMLGETMGGGASDRLALEDTETDQSVRSQKKKEERDKLKLMKQFDALAQQFENSK